MVCLLQQETLIAALFFLIVRVCLQFLTINSSVSKTHQGLIHSVDFNHSLWRSSNSLWPLGIIVVAR